MADPRTPFPSLEDSNQTGQVLRVGVDTVTPAAGINGAIGFSFKDASGNLVLPQLNAAGEIVVSDPDSGLPKRAHGEFAAGSATIVQVTGALIALAVSKTYKNLGATVTCFRDSLFQLIWNDNGVETILDEYLCGPGQFTFRGVLPNHTFTSGAAGTQELKIKAKNFGALSSLRATIVATEV